MVKEVTATISALESDLDSRAVFLQGASLEGGKTFFSSGADLEWIKNINESDAKALATMFHTLNSAKVPVISLVSGGAFGGALGLMAISDIVITTPASKFAFSEIKHGILPATIAPYINRAIGERLARKLFLTGETFESHFALESGLVHEVVNEIERRKEELEIYFGALSPKLIREVKALCKREILTEGEILSSIESLLAVICR
jgi:methylglutaconyl-CoA hydratase